MQAQKAKVLLKVEKLIINQDVINNMEAASKMYSFLTQLF